MQIRIALDELTSDRLQKVAESRGGTATGVARKFLVDRIDQEFIALQCLVGKPTVRTPRQKGGAK